MSVWSHSAPKPLLARARSVVNFGTWNNTLSSFTEALSTLWQPPYLTPISNAHALQIYRLPSGKGETLYAQATKEKWKTNGTLTQEHHGQIIACTRWNISCIAKTASKSVAQDAFWMRL